VIVAAPRRFGLQEHVATIFGDVPEVLRLIQPGILFPFARKVTFEAISKLALIFTADLKLAESAFAAKAMLLKFEIATV